ncbi:MAG TPA: hypothetical protein VJ552_10065 [Sediminibacterium sp.]|nr:hypothetical protein [Sediminibacterium sp.]
MVFLFRDKSVINILFLAILSLVAHFHLFFQAPVVLATANDGFFSIFLRRWVTGLDASLLFLTYLLAILVQAIRLNMLLLELKMFPQPGYTLAMSYILLSGLMTQWCAITPALFANFLLIWLFIKITRLFNQANPKSLLFNIGLIIGITVLCYHPTAILTIVVLFSLAIIRPFKLQEWFILLMGILLPYYFLGAGLFLDDRLGTITRFLPNPGLVLPVTELGPPLIISSSLILLSLLSGLICWQQFNSRLVIQIRKNWAVMLLMGLILLAVPFIFEEAGIQAAFLCLVPLSAFTSNAFSYPKRMFFPNLLFLLLLGGVLYTNWLVLNNNWLVFKF